MGRQSREKTERRELARREADRVAQRQQAQNAVPQFVTQIEGVVFRGPLPPPEILARYEQVQPGFANRIFEMAESNQRHRQSLEAQVIPARVKNERLGQIFGLVIALVVIACAMYLIVNGFGTTGFVILIADLTALVAVFVYADQAKRKELRNKRGS
ncbi:MAG: DUF2335 domain-containing protein [Thermoanaerobaculia bacterium]